MKRSTIFKGIKFQNNTADHTLHCSNQDTQMVFHVMTAKPIVIDDNVKYDCEAAFNELFAAHRMFGEEEIFGRKGGEIKIAINGHTFASEGYDETSIVLDDGNTFTNIFISTKGGFTIDSLYQFHDDIKEFLDQNEIEL